MQRRAAEGRHQKTACDCEHEGFRLMSSQRIVLKICWQIKAFLSPGSNSLWSLKLKSIHPAANVMLTGLCFSDASCITVGTTTCWLPVFLSLSRHPVSRQVCVCVCACGGRAVALVLLRFRCVRACRQPPPLSRRQNNAAKHEW